jgi:hypothetical protein
MVAAARPEYESEWAAVALAVTGARRDDELKAAIARVHADNLRVRRPQGVAGPQSPRR